MERESDPVGSVSVFAPLCPRASTRGAFQAFSSFPFLNKVFLLENAKESPLQTMGLMLWWTEVQQPPGHTENILCRGSLLQ